MTSRAANLSRLIQKDYSACLKFTSVSGALAQNVLIPASASLNNSSFTFSCLVMPTTTKIMILAGKDFITSWRLFFNSASRLRLEFDAKNDAENLSALSAIPQNKWTRVGITFNATTKLQCIYINGILDNSRTASVDIGGADNTDFTYGSHKTSGSFVGTTGFEGMVDEVKLFNRDLSADEMLIDATGGLVSDYASSCVLYHKLDEGSGTSAFDATANGNNGTIQGGGGVGVPTYSTDVLNTVRSAASGRVLSRNFGTSLLNTTGYVSFPYATFSALTNKFTFECFVRENKTASQGMIFSLGYKYSDGLGFACRIDSSGILGFYNGNVPYTANTNIITVKPDIWHHFAVVYDGAAYKGYIDCILQRSVTVARKALSEQIHYIGDETGTGAPHKGYLDECRVYDTDLSLSQLQDSMNKGFLYSPYAHFKFDEGSGLIATDSSGNGRNGALKASGISYSSVVPFGLRNSL